MTTSPPPLPAALAAFIQDELHNTFGAWLICACVACMLFGLTTHQTYRYFRLYPNDGKSMKMLVNANFSDQGRSTSLLLSGPKLSEPVCFGLRCLEDILGLYEYVAFSIFDSANLIMFSEDFHNRDSSSYDASSYGLLMISEFAFAIAVTAMTFILVTFGGFKSHMWMIWVLLANAVLIDVVVTGFLMFYLWKSRTGFKRPFYEHAHDPGHDMSFLNAFLVQSISMPGNLLWSSIYVVASKNRGLEGFETGSFGLQIIDPRDMRPMDFKAPLRSPAPRQSMNPNSPNLKVSTGGATTAESSVADTVIDIKVTTETFVDIPSSTHGHGHGAQGGPLLPHADDKSDDRESL
ncbi:hypothetical protein DICSQDRAFT_130208 [Dichomitus squalens LYAD-421 SS1]|uniref:Uncharacterized protein n=1 Tax=Dichomitus squalens (strain LYAD-421) TaxID=732165 RepID=R7SJA9_DICSQ|nr:uncharacterized protein DICSQDRAFT_130208 [Dichomitus squalens LYAD-421 SS1]EJF56214.1 hypothetical protein DICSQDRAFT_130208 [Dichomitus squalens LYAD-421 SS1]